MTDLRNLVAVVTGASSGIGEGLARMLCSEGVKVALAARRGKKLEKLSDELRAHGGTTLVVPTDAREEAQLVSLIERTKAELGPIDILVNNAGIAHNQPMHALNMKYWDQLMAVNLRTPVFLASRVLPGMRERRRGFIVNVVSEAGMFVYPDTGAYGVSKHALRVATQLTQDENQAFGIKAWAICPGVVDTRMGANVPHGNPEHFLKVDDIVDLVRFLVTRGANVKLGPDILIRSMRDPITRPPHD